MTSPYRLVVALCLASAAQLLPAHAEDVPPAVQAMLDNFERQSSIKPSYETIETDGSGNVTITNLTMNKEAANGGPAITTKVAEVSLSEISDEGDGLYEIGSATFSDMSASITGNGFAMTITMPEGEAEDWYVRSVTADAAPEDQFRASMNLARKMSSGKLSVTAMGQSFTADGYETTWDGDPKTGTGTFTMKVSNIAIPEQALAMIDQMGILKQLGYAGLGFDVTSEGQMDVSGGNLGMDFNVGLAGKDIGTLQISGAAADIPLAAYAELQKAQKTGAQPDFNAMMPQLQAVTFKSAALRFEDSSLTKRLLPMLAKMQGMDEATLVATAGAMTQMGLMQLQSQAFTDQAVAAVNSFLKDPKSITVSINPPAPVKVMELMTLNPAQPAEALTKLGVAVTAND